MNTFALPIVIIGIATVIYMLFVLIKYLVKPKSTDTMGEALANSIAAFLTWMVMSLIWIFTWYLFN